VVTFFVALKKAIIPLLRLLQERITLVLLNGFWRNVFQKDWLLLPRNFGGILPIYYVVGSFIFLPSINSYLISWGQLFLKLPLKVLFRNGF